MPIAKHPVTISGDNWLHHLDWLSRLLDTAFAIPGTRYRIGLDGLFGLLPGIGDSVGAILSSYIIFVAARLGASKQVLIRMVGNVALESLIGLIPILGDIFDIAWKANVRNVALLRANTMRLGRRPRSQCHILALVVVVLLLIVIGLSVVSILLLRFLYQMVTA
jgi:hypothetical protein